MRRWLGDDPFRAALRNAGHLPSAKAIGALLSLVSLACAARTLIGLVGAGSASLLGTGLAMGLMAARATRSFPGRDPLQRYATAPTP